MRELSLILLSALLQTLAWAGPICHIQRYDENDGLAQWHVTQMLQDAQGMMWFSTWNGLCRFDGYGFSTFKGHVGDGGVIATDRIRNMWLAPDGNIGCRVDDAYFLFNLKTYRFQPAANVAVSSKHGVSVKDGKPFAYTDAQGTVWTVYRNGTLTYKMRGGAETAYSAQPPLEKVHFCLPDRQGQLWVVSTYCIYKLSFLSPAAQIQPDGGAEVKSICLDASGRCWVSSKENSEVRTYNANGTLAGYLTPSGTISPNKTSFSSPVYVMYKSADGTMWLGSKPGGLFRLRAQGAIYNNKVSKGPKGMLAAASYTVEKIGGLSCNDVYDVKEDRRGRLWVATLGGGVNCIVNPQAAHPTVLTPAKGLPNYPNGIAQRARMIHITRGNVMLIATTDGLVVARIPSANDMTAMPFRLHTRENGRKDALSCSATMNVCEDSRHRIYVSTESGGVNRIETGNLMAPQLSFRHYDQDCGMPTDVALSVVPFSNDRLLVVSSNQFMVLNTESGICMPFGRSFFQSECRFSEATPLLLPDGRWMFGLLDGTLSVETARLRKSSFVPNIALTQVNIQGAKSDIAINALDTLVLGKAERSLTLMFAALDYSPDADIRYAFCLKKNGEKVGRDEWNNVGRDHSVTLLDLDPETYTLLIRSTNADGVWVDNVRRLTIIVTPTFLETTFARVLILILVLAILGGIAYTVVYIRRISRQRREALEAYLALLNTEEDKGQEAAPEQSAPVAHLTEEDDALMRKISQFVEQHISDADIGVGDLADAAAMSRSGLQRKMKQALGVTPLDFLREARIKHACHLLRTTQLTVGEVAYSSGFSDPKYFSRCFKASVGQSPTEYKSAQN